MNGWNLSGINNGLDKVKAIHHKEYCNVVSFIRTIPSVPESHRFCQMLADLRRMPPEITAGVDFHHALKQIILWFAA